ncbi:metallophosphoesterase family protein [Devosia sp. A16]|uniref:metallophosphoesterase family protein n=1 Tax=Devosia sp. A16 TaxID=1736675 RepID=UPI0006D7F0D0|nr:metallophosphoesterase [Devosia sp. A16]
MRAGPTVIAHLSDPHLDARPVTLHRLRQVIAALGELPRLDAVVITGDIADGGLASEYQAVMAEIAGLPPTLVTTGNHCLRAAFEAQVGPRNSQLEVSGLRIVGLDTARDGRDEGLLDDATLAYARQAIGSAPGAVLLALHHPPVDIGHPIIDATKLSNPEALAGLLASSPAVIGVLTGHVHTPHVTQFAGVPLIGAPGIVSTLRINEQERLSADGAAPPGFAVHVIDRGRLATRFVALGPQPDSIG